MAFLRTGQRQLTATFALLLLLPLRLAWGDASADQEYALKAVFLYNFCRFIEWPERAFGSPDEPMVIGVVGDNPFGRLIEETVRGETVRGRRIRVQYYRRASEIDRCHVLFASASEMNRADEIIASVAGKSVVTVGETDVFLDRGGMIALTADQSRVRLRINPAALRAENLVASSKLLRVAEIKR
jgi:hypothetical protein